MYRKLRLQLASWFFTQVEFLVYFPFLNGGLVVVGLVVLGLKTGPSGVVEAGAAGAVAVAAEVGADVNTHLANL